MKNETNPLLEHVSNDPIIEIIYFQITDLWKRFCEEHTRLFNSTCDEYESLLDNNLDRLEVVIDDKQKIITRISRLEALRKEIIEKLNETIDEKYPSLLGEQKNIRNVKELLLFMTKIEGVKNHNHLQRFNNLLVDIIEKIQEQNKRNQLYINKAVKNIEEVRNGIIGDRPFKTYTATGTTKFNTQG